MTDVQPIAYTARDYASLRQSMLDDALTKLPEWTSRSPNDFGVVLIEEFAYMGDILSYYIDRVAAEAFLATATQRASILHLAEMLDYRPDTGQASTVTLSIGVVPGTGTVAIPKGTQFSSASLQPDVVPVVVFETDEDLFITQDTSVVAFGTVTATQGETVSNEEIGTSTGGADQTFPLVQNPVIEASVVVSVDEGSGPIAWVFVEHLIDYGPDDQVFTTTTDATGRTRVLFGDNVNGQVPANSAVITATYRVGGGTVGNVGPQAINTVVSAPSEVTSVVNPASAEGGTDAETNDQIRRNAPRALSTLHRAVTLADYANLAYNVTGVAKARADGTSYTAITVYVAPTGGGQPSTTLKQRVLEYLSDKKMINAQITAADPVYVPLTVVVDVTVASQFAQSTVNAAVRNAIGESLLFDKVDFGQLVSVSDIYRVVMAVPGVEHATVTELHPTVSGSGAANVQMAVNEIPTIDGGVITVNVISGGFSSAVGGITGGGDDIIPGAPGAPVIDSISCGVSNQFTMALHWSAGTNATSYRVTLDFWEAGTYVGSRDGGSFTTTNGEITDTFAGADEVRVRVTSVRGSNTTPGAQTIEPYSCG